jgi:hypothetical protein
MVENVVRLMVNHAVQYAIVALRIMSYRVLIGFY